MLDRGNFLSRFDAQAKVGIVKVSDLYQMIPIKDRQGPLFPGESALSSQQL